MFTAFLPAISKDALKRLSRTVRRWQIHRRLDLSWAELAEMINPVVRGWMSYYGRFYRSALNPLLARINSYLVRWIRKKYRRLRPRRKARVVWERIIAQHPRYFAHWAWVRNPLMMARVVRAE
ncbi:MULTISPECIES: group II intron maturase-specific domain-containing protein [unclassified Micromonospora]|uniref:group II intron maturase-specific domain-containing protein n=1 Tax=unclassified Micromonospora TaxID=2617518 RepID=UPI003A877AFE